MIFSKSTNPIIMARKLLVLGLILYAAVDPLSAQKLQNEKYEKDSLRIYNMDEVVVTATRVQQELKKIPQRINVVPIYRMQSNPVISVDDVLNQISGITMNRTNGFLSKKSVVSLRGMGFEQGRTLVLIDGIVANKASTGGVNFNQFNPYIVERIEIVKGPGSSLYGGNSMGGTINIINRIPQKKMEGNASFRWGEMGTYATNATIGGKEKQFYYLLNGYYQKSNGYNSMPEADRDSSTIASNLNEFGFNGNMGIGITKDQILEITAAYYNGLRGNGSRYFYKDPYKGSLNLFNHYKEQSYRLLYKGKTNEWNWKLSGAFGQEDYLEKKSKGSDLYDIDCIRRDWSAWGNAHYEIMPDNLLGFGVEVKGGYVDGQDRYVTATDVVINRGKNTLFGFWAQDEISLLDDRMKIIPSLRYDFAHLHDAGFYIENPTSVTNIYEPYTGKLTGKSWHALSPKLSILYRFDDYNRIFANTGWGFRPGTLENMTRTGPISGGVVVANPNLKPEKIQTTEIGGDWYFLNRFTLSPSAYFSAGRNFIYNVNTGKTILMGKKERPLLLTSNIAKVHIFGVEADLTAALTDAFNLFANYSYTHSKIHKGTAFISGDEVNLKDHYLTYVPKTKISAGGVWRNRWVSINLAYIQYSSQYADDLNKSKIAPFGTVDVKLWHVFENRFTVSLNGKNLFNRQVDIAGNMSIGRFLFAEVGYKF